MNKARSDLISLAVDLSQPEDKIVAAIKLLRNCAPNHPAPPARNYLTIRGLMEFLCVSRTQVWKMRRGGLPSYRIGAKILFKASEAEAWLHSQQK